MDFKTAHCRRDSEARGSVQVWAPARPRQATATGGCRAQSPRHPASPPVILQKHHNAPSAPSLFLHLQAAPRSARKMGYCGKRGENLCLWKARTVVFKPNLKRMFPHSNVSHAPAGAPETFPMSEGAWNWGCSGRAKGPRAPFEPESCRHTGTPLPHALRTLMPGAPLGNSFCAGEGHRGAHGAAEAAGVLRIIHQSAGNELWAPWLSTSTPPAALRPSPGA